MTLLRSTAAGIGLGHTWRYINKMIMGGGIPMCWNWVLGWVNTSLDKMNTRDGTPMDKQNVVIGVVTWQNRFRGGIPRCPSLKLIILGLLNYFQFQFQYLIYYHTTPRGNFVYKLGTILSSNGNIFKQLQTKCKTCFGGPRMILHANWKNTFPKLDRVNCADSAFFILKLVSL